ncbi:unnamed protein product [Rangifer tarandus platyrhynchus]|uniref:Secreted protein n=2 Tax=Rangifer tarandus platyrhynchus TaxID=3082113 RepID=A0ABN8YSN5_RANTA|nr:unnamed protein product [Rangifer tarandus platyrhynchus]
MCICAELLRLYPTLLWTVACQAPLSMGSSRQEYWSGLPCPPPAVFLTQGSNLCFLFLHWQAVSLPLVPPRKPQNPVEKCESRMRFFVTPWTIQFMDFFRPEYWSG